jgi:hypothetical protein
MLDWRDVEMATEAEKLTDRESEEDEAFLRRIIFCEEDRRKFTSAPWTGGYRWFRSPNIIPIEQRRRRDSHKSPHQKAS